ncbi:hypothetical protein V473_19935 [Sphingobium cupriresistens LL01]|uniref:Uncharacterized protein n=1 Tax=Sphingobium cupriresistens LL01 TaxID=1420583 RepID=A0A0J7XN36_9SPHN|nr:hypothetical protein V473_19935 [Sphingobium cupriresistens LL01]
MLPKLDFICFILPDERVYSYPIDGSSPRKKPRTIA